MQSFLSTLRLVRWMDIKQRSDVSPTLAEPDVAIAPRRAETSCNNRPHTLPAPPVAVTVGNKHARVLAAIGCFAADEHDLSGRFCLDLRTRQTRAEKGIRTRRLFVSDQPPKFTRTPRMTRRTSTLIEKNTHRYVTRATTTSNDTPVPALAHVAEPSPRPDHSYGHPSRPRAVDTTSTPRSSTAGIHR